MIQIMFKKQLSLQKKMKVKFNQEYINTMTLAAIDELMESLRETPWKPWKKNQTFNKEKYKEELIDVWHFLINLSIASGMNYKEVCERFLNKNKVNFNRQNEGY